MINTIIFDFDGLILDTETPLYLAYREVCRKHGQDMPIEFWANIVGTNHQFFDPYQYLIELSAKKLDRDQLKQDHLAEYEIIMKDIRPRPGVVEYLEEARQLGLKIGLASSSHLDWIEKYLGILQLTTYFDCICTADDVKEVKPDPELYHLALDRLQAQGNTSIAFEDSPNGARAAKAAGIYCVVIPNEMTKHLPFDSFEYRLETMADLPLQQLIKKLIV